MKRDINSIHTISTLQDASQFHHAGNTSTRFSNIGDLHTVHKGYSTSVYHKGRSPRDINAVKQTKIMQDINNVKERN